MDQKAIQFHIFVVDDEPIGADDLSDLIRERFAGEYNLDVQTAYNAHAVLTRTENRPCDVLISDIKMPGMSGLELGRRMRERFPDLKLLFLTGFDDFSYAYEAFQNNASHFLLKTEGDEAILAAVEETLEELVRHRLVISRIREAEKQYETMLPAYRHHHLLQSLMGMYPENESDEVRNLISGPLYLVVARLGKDDTRQRMRPCITALSAVEQMVKDALGNSLQWTESFMLNTEMIWILSITDEVSYASTLFQLLRKARKYIELQLGIPMFFVISDHAVPYCGLSRMYEDIREMLLREIETDATGVAISRETPHSLFLTGEEVKNQQTLRTEIEMCRKDIHDSNLELAARHMQPLLEYVRSCPASSDLFSKEIVTALSGQMLGYVNRNGLKNVIEEVEKFTGLNDADYLEKFMSILMDNTQEEMEFAADSIARYLEEYIQKHIGEDINISALTEITGYSSGYLSRVFKSHTGISIHEYVTNARIALAQQLLSSTNLRVYEIAANCGFANSTYFIRVFKERMGMTPQEYKQNKSSFPRI